MTNRTFKAGISRDQPSFLPPRVEDYVAGDNPVRVIEAFVAALNLGKLGFRHAGSSGGAGQPPYDPADLLKLYLYGYLNRIRSSRSLEREAGRIDEELALTGDEEWALGWKKRAASCERIWRELEQRFAEALSRMSFDNPRHREVLEAEGLRRWVEPELDGYHSLREASWKQGFFKRN